MEVLTQKHEFLSSFLYAVLIVRQKQTFATKLLFFKKNEVKIVIRLFEIRDKRLCLFIGFIGQCGF